MFNFVSRFTADERAKRPQLCHIPFGFGPRSCIGIRFALLMTKITLMELLKKYSIITAPDTEVLAKQSTIVHASINFACLLIIMICIYNTCMYADSPADCVRCYYGTKEWHLSQSHQPSMYYLIIINEKLTTSPVALH